MNGMLQAFGFVFSGLDNKLTLYPLNMDDDANKYKKVVATHANYISSCKFMHSDQQVIIFYSFFNQLMNCARGNIFSF